MNKQQLTSTISILSTLLFTLIWATSCTSPARKAQQGAANWTASMHQFSYSLSNLIPYLNNPQAFSDPDNRKTIQKSIKTLSKLSHGIEKVKMAPDQDPSLGLVTREFIKDMELANREYAAGRYNNARYLVKNTSNYCISCHTRTSQGAHNFQLALNPDLSNFSALDQAAYFSATRQFDKALNSYDKALTDSNQAKRDPWTWMTGTKNSLAIAVRVKQDPKLAQELVARLFDKQAIPMSFKEEAREWQRSIKQWQKAKSKKSQTNTRTKKLREAKKLIKRAQKKVDYPLGNQGLIDYLRASSLLHEVLAKPAKDMVYGQSLYYAGLAAEALKDTTFWDLDEVYYEACIRNQPKTNLAKNCYVRFEKLKYRNYIGGYMENEWFPEHERKKLEELKSLAGLK